MNLIVLASGSKIRSRLLENAGISHVVDAAFVNETELKEKLRKDRIGIEPATQTLAQTKAAAIAKRHPGAYVIGADQILELDDWWFNKPRDMEQAVATLKILRGHTHRLVSAVSVYHDNESLWKYVETANLTMRDFSDTFIERYIAESGLEILESVGGYRLERTGAQLFARIEGNYFTILGLPLLALLEFLREVGVLTE